MSFGTSLSRAYYPLCWRSVPVTSPNNHMVRPHQEQSARYRIKMPSFSSRFLSQVAAMYCGPICLDTVPYLYSTALELQDLLLERFGLPISCITIQPMSCMYVHKIASISHRSFVSWVNWSLIHCYLY